MTKRHSKKREQILAVLKNTRGALSAAALHQQLPELNLTTIYRNLDAFVADGTVKKFQLGGTEAFYEYTTAATHHAFCSQCNKVIRFTAADEQITQLLGLDDFFVDELEVTVRGTCKQKPEC